MQEYLATGLHVTAEEADAWLTCFQILMVSRCVDSISRASMFIPFVDSVLCACGREQKGYGVPRTCGGDLTARVIWKTYKLSRIIFVKMLTFILRFRKVKRCLKNRNEREIQGCDQVVKGSGGCTF
jgi:hypothetical protein